MRMAVFNFNFVVQLASCNLGEGGVVTVFMSICLWSGIAVFW